MTEALEAAREAARAAISKKKNNALKKPLSDPVIQALQGADSDAEEEEVSNETIPKPSAAQVTLAGKTRKPRAPRVPKEQANVVRAGQVINLNEPLNEPTPFQIPTQVPTQVPIQVPSSVPTQVPTQVSSPPAPSAPIGIKEKLLDPELKEYISQKVQKKVDKALLIYHAEQAIASKNNPMHFQQNDALILARAKLNEKKKETLYPDLFPTSRKIN
jgi:hypothetical protein